MSIGTTKVTTRSLTIEKDIVAISHCLSQSLKWKFRLSSVDCQIIEFTNNGLLALPDGKCFGKNFIGPFIELKVSLYALLLRITIPQNSFSLLKTQTNALSFL